MVAHNTRLWVTLQGQSTSMQPWFSVVDASSSLKESSKLAPCDLLRRSKVTFAAFAKSPVAAALPSCYCCHSTMIVATAGGFCRSGACMHVCMDLCPVCCLSQPLPLRCVLHLHVGNGCLTFSCIVHDARAYSMGSPWAASDAWSRGTSLPHRAWKATP